jgi:peptide deformylase
MSLLKTAKLGHPIIRHKARTLPVDELMSPDVQRFINDMIETMRDQAAVGIAANQVYSDKCIVVIEVRGDNPRYAERDKYPYRHALEPKWAPVAKRFQPQRAGGRPAGR